MQKSAQSVPDVERESFDIKYSSEHTDTTLELINCDYKCFSRQLEADIKEDFLVRIGDVFGVERTEATHLYTLLLQCMDHRQSVSKTAFRNVCVYD